MYDFERCLLSGSANGSVFFWNHAGNIVKKLQIFKTAVANLLIFDRPREIDEKKSVIRVKKALSFKPFKKYA